MTLPNTPAFPTRIRGGRLLAVVASTALLLGGVATTLAHDDDDDAADLLHAIKKAKLVDLSHPWENTSPVAS